MRETIRGVFENKPERFASLDEALKNISKRIVVPMNSILRKSKLFKKISTQTKVQKFLI